jgi:hypothetical protein
MNTIYGSNDKKKFLHLQKLNDGRAKLNHGMLFAQKESFDIYKVHPDAKDFKFPKRKKYHLLMGMSQKKTREFNPNIINPFIFEQWAVACSGQFTNRKELIEEFCDNPKILNHEGFIVAQLFEKISVYDDNDVNTIINGLSLIEGNFALWAHNAVTGNSFLAKNGINLYADIYENTFSTNNFYGSEQLSDGELYQLTVEGITHVGIFDHTQ